MTRHAPTRHQKKRLLSHKAILVPAAQRALDAERLPPAPKLPQQARPNPLSSTESMSTKKAKPVTKRRSPDFS